MNICYLAGLKISPLFYLNNYAPDIGGDGEMAPRPA